MRCLEPRTACSAAGLEPRRPGGPTAAMALLLLVAPAVSVAAAPGTELTLVARVSGAGPGEKRATTYVARERLRHVDEHLDVRLELAGGRMLVVDLRRRECYETSRAELDRAVAGFDDTMRADPRLAASLPKPDAIEKRLERQGQQVAGLPCDEWVVRQPDSLLELCLSRALDVPSDYVDLWRVAYVRAGVSGRNVLTLLEALRGLAGYPLIFEVEGRVLGVKREIVQEVVELRREPLAADVFEEPADCRRVPSPLAPRPPAAPTATPTP